MLPLFFRILPLKQQMSMPLGRHAGQRNVPDRRRVPHSGTRCLGKGRMRRLQRDLLQNG